MQREIKFEYGFESVNGIVKKTYSLYEIPNIKEKCDVWDSLPLKYIRPYSQIRDKKGVEIYEGDNIVTFGDLVREVCFKNGAFGYYASEDYFISFNQNNNFEWIDGLLQVEVVGNIYENTQS